MTEARRREIEAALAECGETLVLPVDDVRDLLASSRSYDPYSRRLRSLEMKRDDASPRNDDALVDTESL